MKYFIKRIIKDEVSIDFDVLYNHLVDEDKKYYEQLDAKALSFQLSCLFGDNIDFYLKEIFGIDLDESIDDNCGMADVISNDFEVYLEKKLNIND